MEEKSLEQIQEEKKEKKQARIKKTKHFFKLFGFAWLGVLGVAVIAVFGTWVSGGFSTKPIAITSLTVEEGVVNNADTSCLYVSGNEVLIVGNNTYTTKIAYEPADANQLALTVKVKEGKNLLKSVPSVTAGQNFTLEFATDENGNPLCGKIEIQFTTANGLQSTSLKILVDNALTDDVLTLSGTNVTPTVEGGSEYLLAVAYSNNGAQSSFKLQSTSAAYAAKPGFVTFNDSVINNLGFKKSYIYSSDATSLALYGNIEDNYNGNSRAFSVLPVKASVKENLAVYTTKTFIMQNAFNDTWINNIVSNNLANFDYAGYNNFINTFINFINNTQESNSFFADKVNAETGLIELEQSDLLESLNYVFVAKKASFIISDIEIQEISVKGGTLAYNVFSGATYNTTTISVNPENAYDTNYFGIKLISKNNDETNNKILENKIKDVLIAPYVESALYDADAVVEVNGIEYPKYLQISSKNYEYNTDYLQVIKNISASQVSWQINTYKPNANLTSEKNLYFGIIVYGVNAYGEVYPTYALQPVQVNYTTSDVGFKQNRYTIALNETLANNSDISLKKVTITTNDLNKAVSFDNMEYKKLLWFIPATNENENILQKLKESDLYTIEANSEVNKKINLIDINENPIYHSTNNNEYYLVGEDESVELLGLNASVNSVKLYAMVMQTTMPNGQGEICYVEEPGEGNTIKRSYKVVSYTQAATEITVTKYLDKVYTYYRNSQGQFALCNGEENALNITTGGTAELYVTGMLLDESGTPVKYVKDETTGDDVKVNLTDDEINSIKIALNNYLSAFGNKVCWSVSDVNVLSNVETIPYENANYITLKLVANSAVDNVDLTVFTYSPENQQTSKPYVSGQKFISYIKVVAPSD